LRLHRGQGEPRPADDGVGWRVPRLRAGPPQGLRHPAASAVPVPVGPLCHSPPVVCTGCGVDPGVNRKALGELGERWAREYLEQHGYRIRETNYRCREGEVDIVAEHGGCLVFVEVRTKTGSAFGTPEESITPVKQERLAAVAMSYLQTHDGLPLEWRIDVVAIEVGPKGRVVRTELIQNAVS